MEITMSLNLLNHEKDVRFMSRLRLIRICCRLLTTDALNLISFAIR